MNDPKMYDLWGVCETCKDQLSVFFWLRHAGDQVYKGNLEKNSGYYHESGRLYHRCGGTLSLYGPQMRIVLV